MATQRGIEKRLKLWTSSGAIALAGAVTAACDGPADEGATSTAAPVESTLPVADAGEGEGGEGEGEAGGERGIDPVLAAKDPVAYLTALDVIRAHYLAGGDAYAAGDQDAAAELFVHPISEVYIDLEPVFTAAGARGFLSLLEDAAGLAADGARPDAISAAVDAVLDATDAAAAFAPADGDTAQTSALIIADMIERAALQYQLVANGAEGEAYLDGYGFYKTAERRARRRIDEIRAGNTELAGAIASALGYLAGAYPDVEQPDPLPVEPGQLLAASSTVGLYAGG